MAFGGIAHKIGPTKLPARRSEHYAIASNNPRTVPKSEPRVPRNEDIRMPQAVAPTLANPLDLLYYSFGKRPKQLQALRQLQREDYYRQLLEEGSNRQIIEDLTGIPK